MPFDDEEVYIPPSPYPGYTGSPYVPGSLPGTPAPDYGIESMTPEQYAEEQQQLNINNYNNIQNQQGFGLTGPFPTNMANFIPDPTLPWGEVGPDGITVGTGGGPPGSGGGGPPGGGGGGGGGGDGGGLPSNFWEETYSIQGAPSWWRGLTAKDRNPETEYASLMNAMIPFLSPEDQRNVAANLWQMYPTWFESYNPDSWVRTTPAEYETDEYGNVILDEEGKPKIKTPEQVDLNPWARPEQAAPLLLMQEYSSTRAAEQELAALQSMAKAMKLDVDKLGPGFKYIQQIAAAIKGFGANKNPEEGWTRTQKQQYMNTVDPLLAASQGSGSPLSAYSVLAKMLTQPTFTNAEAPLWPYKDPQTGELVWAAPNNQMW